MVDILYLHSQYVLHISQRIPQNKYVILNEGYLESNYQCLKKKINKKHLLKKQFQKPIN